jgi:hypothetical protein
LLADEARVTTVIILTAADAAFVCDDCACEP